MICFWGHGAGGILEKFIINGGNKLYGEINVQGAKNAVLPLLSAAILTEETVSLKNVPDLTDVRNMVAILESLGAQATFKDHTLTIDSSNATKYSIKNSLAKELRSSVFLLGAILSRTRRAIVAYPGGCDIGLRPIDIHIKALKDFGANIEEKSGYVYCDGENISASEIYLDYPSVGATENAMLLASNLKGRSIINNAAREPEIVELQNFINKMGGKITGAGTSRICVEGVENLRGTEYTVMPDRIVTGTYALAVLACGGEVSIKGALSTDINSLLVKLSKSSCNIDINNGIIYINSYGRLKSVNNISTQPYPGFPTDLQAPFMTLETISSGTCVLTENIFENRFKHIQELRKMGADIIINDRTAVIKGVKELYGAEINASDLRGGAALVLAGLAAKGITVVNGIHHIDRGYERIEKVFTDLGADIIRV